MTQRKPYNNLKITEEDYAGYFLRKYPLSAETTTLESFPENPGKDSAYSNKSYRKYELGGGFPPVFVVYHLAVYFGYTMEELLTEKIILKRKDE